MRLQRIAEREHDDVVVFLKLSRLDLRKFSRDKYVLRLYRQMTGLSLGFCACYFLCIKYFSLYLHSLLFSFHIKIGDKLFLKATVVLVFLKGL